MLTVALVLAAVAAGLTGSWSPCGFSMVDTLAPHGYAGRMRVTIAACTTFALGALAGGVATFGGLSPSLRAQLQLDDRWRVEGTIGYIENASRLRLGGGGSEAFVTLRAYYGIVGVSRSF